MKNEDFRGPADRIRALLKSNTLLPVHRQVLERWFTDLVGVDPDTGAPNAMALVFSLPMEARIELARLIAGPELRVEVQPEEEEEEGWAEEEPPPPELPQPGPPRELQPANTAAQRSAQANEAIVEARGALIRTAEMLGMTNNEAIQEALASNDADLINDTVAELARSGIEKVHSPRLWSMRQQVEVMGPLCPDQYLVEQAMRCEQEGEMELLVEEIRASIESTQTASSNPPPRRSPRNGTTRSRT